MSRLSRKKPDVDLRRSYNIHMQLGLIVTLLLMILIFRVDLDLQSDLTFKEDRQRVITMDDIVQTQRHETPPPPMRPQAPKEVPADEVAEDLFFDLQNDFDSMSGLNIPPPPPIADEPYEPEIFLVVEDMPQPVGGMAALYSNLQYPETARRAGIEGRVVIQFLIDENGQPDNFVVIRGIGGGTEDAAIQAIQATQWVPGRQRGMAVPVQFQLPVIFRLQT